VPTPQDDYDDIRQERDHLRSLLIHARLDDIATLQAGAAYMREHGRDFPHRFWGTISDPVELGEWMERTANTLSRTGIYPDGYAALKMARRALAVQQAMANPTHVVGWWQGVWSALTGRAPRALCGESLEDHAPELDMCCRGCAARQGRQAVSA